MVSHPLAAIAEGEGAIEILKAWCVENGYTPETIKIIRHDGVLIAKTK